jgi:hypothetical protein
MSIIPAVHRLHGTTALLLFAFLVCSCAAPLATPSGRPEVTFHSSDRPRIREALISEFIAVGYNIQQDTPSSLVFTKVWDDSQGVLYQAMLGNAYSSTPELEFHVNLASVPEGTRVFMNVSAEMQNAFGRTDRQDLTDGKIAQQCQSLLEKVRSRLEGGGK